MIKSSVVLLLLMALPLGCSGSNETTAGASAGGSNGSAGSGGGPGDAGDPEGGPPIVGPHTILKPVMTEYKSGFLRGDGTFSTFTYVNPPGKVLMTPYGVNQRKVVDAAPGFNAFVMLDDQGYVWSSVQGTADAQRIETDKTGAAFDGNKSVYGYFSTFVTIRSDGSLWYWGNDDYHLFGMSPIPAPEQLSPAGMKLTKVSMGRSIIALDEKGDVYQWGMGGGTTPAHRITPKPAIDIFASHYDYYGCVIPDTAGDTAGYPYVWGSEFGFWGGNAPSTEPTSVKALWKMTAPIKKIAASQNTIHYIDTMGRLFGIGDNPNGEIGNGVELVNHADIYPTPYAWSWNKGEAFTGAPPIEVGAGIKWKDVFKGNAYSFYAMAIDEDDNLYSWGRQKSFILGNGYGNNQEATYPNALDVLVPTKVDPFAVTAQNYDLKLYTIDPGPNQTITGTTATLSGSGTPTTLTAMNPANGKPTIGYTITSYQWTKVSGPGGATITDPSSAKTTVTGLLPGTYVFKLLITDNNTATISGTVTVTVNP